eukprot:193599_1
MSVFTMMIMLLIWRSLGQGGVMEQCYEDCMESCNVEGYKDNADTAEGCGETLWCFRLCVEHVMWQCHDHCMEDRDVQVNYDEVNVEECDLAFYEFRECVGYECDDLFSDESSPLFNVNYNNITGSDGVIIIIGSIIFMLVVILITIFNGYRVMKECGYCARNTVHAKSNAY